MVRELADLAKERFEAMNSFAERFEALETETVRTCEGNVERGARVHVHKGIMELAAEVGAEVEAFDRTDTDYPYGWQFAFDGVRFYQIQATEVPG